MYHFEGEDKEAKFIWFHVLDKRLSSKEHNIMFAREILWSDLEDAIELADAAARAYKSKFEKIYIKESK